jgi:hypothetical protein
MNLKNDVYMMIGGLTLLVLVLFLVLAMPFAQIWAVNTLFKTGIEYNLVNWLAVLVLNSTIKAMTHNNSNTKK